MGTGVPGIGIATCDAAASAAAKPTMPTRVPRRERVMDCVSVVIRDEVSSCEKR
jgi:hypothetical protein